MELLTDINKKAVLKYLGYRTGEVDADYVKKFDDMAQRIIAVARPDVCMALMDIESHEPLILKDGIVFGGDDIKDHLRDSFECILMAATVGSGVDRFIKRCSVKNMADAVIADACASAAVENVCENFCAELRKEAGKNGLFITDRFSPGYGDMPLYNQRIICDILCAEKKIGVYCSQNMILSPSKSVTAIAGVTKNVQEKRRECENCRLFYDCSFRKRGVTCYE